MTTEQPATGVRPAPFSDPRRWPHPVQVIATLALIALAVTGIALGARALAVASSPDLSPSPPADVAAAAAAVDWSAYKPGFRAELEADDCATLAATDTVAPFLTTRNVELAPMHRFIVAVARSKGCTT